MKDIKGHFTTFTTTIVLAFTVFHANANDCSLYSEPKKAIKCLNKKVVKLEAQLKQANKDLPKGAILDFAAKSCPAGWSEYRLNTNGIVNLKADGEIIKCQKQ